MQRLVDDEAGREPGLVDVARGPSGQQLFLRELSGLETKALPGTARATTPFFSPDGRWVGFWRLEDHKLWKVSVSGGPPIEIGAMDTPFTALWGADDEILLEGARQLWSISAAGGQPREIPIRDRSQDESISLRARIPGGSDLLIASQRPEGPWLEVLSRDTGKRRRLLRGGGMVVAPDSLPRGTSCMETETRSSPFWWTRNASSLSASPCP